MKYLFLALITFSSALLSMQPAPEDLQKKIAAARLYNRTQCPLARLPKDVQDMIAQYLEFNDRESDEEFIRNTQHLKKAIIHDSVFSPIKKISKMYGYIDEKLKEKNRQQPNRCTGLCYNYSRNKAKIIMFQSTNRYSANYITYFVIYDLRADKELYFVEQSEGDDSNISVAVSNDGKYFFRKSIHPPSETRLVDATTSQRIYNYPHDLIGKNFNKQSTKAISENNVITLLCSEEEDRIKSKKTLAAYLHQKGICKPFDYSGATL